ncbi:hypothetical protein GCM10008967_03490 [Bacillus carboniphilus]|uniref:DUF4878 domain-containing protein n=1 Tax=Bacillus carboniphilus TaxID=86663 RepID=A0ABN0VSI9_9BACI
MRRRRKTPGPLILILLGAVLTLGYCTVTTFGANSPKEVVEQFYRYEQNGDFGNAWELFHSEMKKRFDKSDYIQTKNHVFLGHMAVSTFDVKVGDTNKINRWTFFNGGPVFEDVHEVDVTLTFESQFGIFEMHQKAYAVKEDGAWRVLWNYDFEG